MDSNDNSLKNETSPSKPLWEYPWGYIESFVIAAELLILGFILEFVTGGQGIEPISMPFNFYILIAFSGLLLILRIFFSSNNIVKWLSGVPAAISSITAFAAITLLMGFIPQSTEKGTGIIDMIGFTHLKNGWPILLIQIYLLSSLGLVCLKRTIPFKIKNIGFILNHFGLWLTLVAALFGSGDLKRLTINLMEEGNANNIAVSQTGQAYKLPFELKLLNFHIDEYVPRLVLVEANSGKFLLDKGKSPIPIEAGKTYTMQKWNVKIEKTEDDLVTKDSILIPKTTPGSFPGALVTVTDKSGGIIHTGWLGTGSFAFNPVFINLGNNVLLALTLPEVKKYRSDVVVTMNKTLSDTVSIEVNKPFNIAGWRIYQLGYDENKGKWSNLSILEAVSDPWIKFVYIGVFMMLAGAVYLFWMGRQKTTK